MKLSKLLLTSTTALGLSMTAAVAGNNDAFTEQQGNNNDVSVTQTGDDNKAGTGSLPVLQDNADVDDDPNNIVIEQIGSDNKAGTSGTGIVQKKTQNENKEADNSLDLLQDGANNEVTEVSQTAGKNGTNTVDVDQTGDDNLISRIEQDRANGKPENDADIVMSGNRNTINLVSQRADLSNQSSGQTSAPGGNTIDVNISGDDNGGGSLTGVAAVTASGELFQEGRANNIDLDISGAFNQFGVSQTGNVAGRSAGSNNQVGTLSIVGDSNELGVNQFGRDNTVSVGTIYGASNLVGITQDNADNLATVNLINDSDDNIVSIDQDDAFGSGGEATVRIEGDNNGGDRNMVDIYQQAAGWADVGIEGDDNDVSVSQFNWDEATVRIDGANTASSQEGDDNVLSIVQGLSNGANPNTIDVSIFGDGNNDGSFSGGVLVAAGKATGYQTFNDLQPGELSQKGQGNEMTLTVGLDGTSEGDDNLFAASQDGDFNILVGKIEGNDNQAVVGQTGDSNSVTFTQSGDANMASAIQMGNNNSATITQ